MMKRFSIRISPAKSKAALALTAFVVVAALAITLTMVGIFDYATLNLGVQSDGSQASAVGVPVSTMASSVDFSLVQGN